MSATTIVRRAMNVESVERLSLQIAIGVVISWLMGLHNVYKILMALQILDILSGLIAAGKAGSISSTIGRAGLRRKGSTWLVILTIYLLQLLIPDTFSQFSYADWGPAELITASFIVMEAASILENAHKAGVPLPGWLIKWLASAQKSFGYESKSEIE